MGYFIAANSGKVAYGVKSFIIDTARDIYNLPHCEPGSTAYCIESGDIFIMNTKRQWSLEEEGENSVDNKIWVGTEKDFLALGLYDKDIFYIITELNESETNSDEEEEDVFWIDLTKEGDRMVSTKTFGEIVTAFNNNKLPVFRLKDTDQLGAMPIYGIFLEEKEIYVIVQDGELVFKAESDDDYPSFQVM